jgi:hypothetical protein
MTNCATFNKRGFEDNLVILEDVNITKFNGIYNYLPSRGYRSNGEINQEIPLKI